MIGQRGQATLSRRGFVVAAGATMVGAGRSAPLCAQERPSGHSDERPAGPLRWAPPPQEAARTITIEPGFYASPEFGPDEDVIVTLPAVAMPNGANIQINGGRHVRIIGGHLRGRLMWRGGHGSMFAEGLLIDLTAVPNRDAITVSGTEARAPDIYLQNIVVTGVQGTFAGLHADVFQAYGPMGHLRVHAMTADTNYQGFFIRPEYPIARATFSRVNMKFNRLGTPEGRTYLFWCRNMHGSPARGDPFYPVEFGPDVYAEPNDRAPGRPAVFPPPGFRIPGRGGGEFEGMQGAEDSIGWPEEPSGITGRVLLGPPKDKDMVEGTDVGVGYRSPGYES